MQYKAVLKNVVNNGFRNISHEFIMFDLGQIKVINCFDAEIIFDETVINKVKECLIFNGVRRAKFIPIQEES